MAQLKDIKDRIKGIKGTQKITNAMKSMALIKLQKAEARALASRPFIYAITDVVSHLDVDNVYFKGNKSKDALFVIFTSDRGLCGSFNENLLRAADETIKENNKAARSKLILVGTKAAIHFHGKDHDVYSTYSHLPADPTVSLSNLVMSDCKKLFLEGKVGHVYLIYNNFRSKVRYEVKTKKMLPLPKMVSAHYSGIKPIFTYEPEKQKVAHTAIEMFLESTVFHSFLDLYASEYSARLTAMTKATENAEEMITALILEYHKTRQAMITEEILEIISGAEALSV